jgi:hypothetical protein
MYSPPLAKVDRAAIRTAGFDEGEKLAVREVAAAAHNVGGTSVHAQKFLALSVEQRDFVDRRGPPQELNFQTSLFERRDTGFRRGCNADFLFNIEQVLADARRGGFRLFVLQTDQRQPVFPIRRINTQQTAE